MRGCIKKFYRSKELDAGDLDEPHTAIISESGHRSMSLVLGLYSEQTQGELLVL